MGGGATDDALFYTFFFFSSRRRHTRFDCDWSSDVCSSDLPDGRLPWLYPDFKRRSISFEYGFNTRRLLALGRSDGLSHQIGVTASLTLILRDRKSVV